jgi:hypothetical protein
MDVDITAVKAVKTNRIAYLVILVFFMEVLLGPIEWGGPGQWLPVSRIELRPGKQWDDSNEV